MNFEMPNFIIIAPELFVLSMACVILLVDPFLKDSQRAITFFLSLITLAGAALLTFYLQPAEPTIDFSGTFVSDGMSVLLKLFIYLVIAVVFVYSREYLQQRGLYRGEFFVLGLFGVLGMMIIVSAHSLLTIYLGLELLSLAMYALVALQRDSAIASEAAMKYFVLGALASGILLYGMSMLYGVTGTLDIAELSHYIHTHEGLDNILMFGVVFVIVGLGFKLGAVPFHMWVPDIYHGAPTSVTLFISSAPKIAAFAMVMRLLVEGLGGLAEHWQTMIVIITVLSIATGNIFAIAQNNLKRMLAYSAIAHIGFMLLGIATASVDGYSAAMFYVIVYTLMGIGGFGMIILLTRSGYEADLLEDFKGLNLRSPWFAFVMLIFMFSMAGVPPFLGFWAKLAVLQAVIEADMLWLAVVAVIFAVIGAYYYLRIVWHMYFDKPIDSSEIESPGDMKVLISINGLAILALGIYPTALMTYCLVVLR